MLSPRMRSVKDKADPRNDLYLLIKVQARPLPLVLPLEQPVVVAAVAEEEALPTLEVTP